MITRQMQKLVAMAVVLVLTACPAKKKATPTATEPDGETPVVTVETPPEEILQPLQAIYPLEEATAEEETLVEGETEAEASLPPPSSSEEYPFVMPEFPTPPESNLAKFRDFWLGMTIENFAFVAFPPAQSETETTTAESKIESGQEGEVSHEEPSPEGESSAISTESAPKNVKARFVYRLLPFVVDEPEFTRFICNTPNDSSIANVTFVFFKDRLHSIEVFYRSAYFDKVIVGDFLVKVKEKFGEPSVEEWKKKDIEGKLIWEDDKYNVQMKIIGGRPFFIKYLQKEIDNEARTYLENLRKEHSTKKIEEAEF